MKSILITGGNRGLGLGVVKYLSKLDKYKIYFTTRNLSGINDILEKNDLNKKNLEILELDINNYKIENLKHLKIDIFINNAGVLFREDESLDNYKKTLNTNFYQTIKLTKDILDHNIVNKNGLIINVSSKGGILDILNENEFKKKVIEFDEKNIDFFVNEYLKNDQNYQNIKYNTMNGYRFSKLLLSLWNLKNGENIYKEKNIKLLGICPGWIRTDMGGNNAPDSLDDGIKKMISLIEMDEKVILSNLGLFYHNYEFYNITNNNLLVK